MRLYHFSGGLLGPGSTILPGNWGRLIRRFGWQHTASGREMLLEVTRQQNHPHQPSRLESCFAFLSQDEAERFRPMGFQNHVLYEVSLADPNAPQFIGDSSRCTAGDFSPDWANQYWRPITQFAQLLPPQVREVVTLSPLKVERQISDQPVT